MVGLLQAVRAGDVEAVKSALNGDEVDLPFCDALTFTLQYILQSRYPYSDAQQNIVKLLAEDPSNRYLRA